MRTLRMEEHEKQELIEKFLIFFIHPASPTGATKQVQLTL